MLKTKSISCRFFFRWIFSIFSNAIEYPSKGPTKNLLLSIEYIQKSLIQIEIQYFSGKNQTGSPKFFRGNTHEIILQIGTLSQFSPSFFMVDFHFSHTNSEGNGQSCFRHKKMVTKKVQNSSIVGYFSIQSGYVKKRYPVSQNLGQTT